MKTRWGWFTDWTESMMGAIASRLESLLGTAGVIPWEQVPTPLQQSFTIALAPGSSPAAVVYPQTPEELSAVLTWAFQDGIRLLPCGSGSKLRWGGLAEGIQVIVSTARMNRLLDHAVGDMTITAEAGLSLATLQQTLGQTGQFLSIDPAYPQAATLGGIVATADTGALRHRYGGIRDLLIGFSLVRSDGQIAKAGGRVVKNVAGYDLMKLLTGSYGSLGILSQLTFRTYPLPEASGTVVVTGDSGAIASLTQGLLLSSLSPTAVELLAPATVASLHLGRGMGLLIRFQSIAVSVTQQISQTLQMAQSVGLAGESVSDRPEADLWKRLRHQWDQPAHSPAITGKIGVRPSNAVALLEQVSQMVPLHLGTIHAGSGLGILHMAAEAIAPATLQEIRDRCQSFNGFLSILEAPAELKQQIDIWGIAPQSLTLMQGIKHRFDPQQLLSPARFISPA